MDNINSLEMGREVINTEIEALTMMRDALDEQFLTIVDVITNCKGKVVFTGIGKPGHICKKLAATFSSLGTPSFYLHPAEAQHGDLGMISEDDVVLAISYSGESDEVIRLIPNIHLIGAKIIGITAKPKSTLGSNSDYVQILPKFEEACYMHLAPTSSTTVELAYGDALAVAVAYRKGFQKENFAAFHPAGALGKKLILKVSDLMFGGTSNAVSPEDSSLQDTIVEMSTKRLGAVSVVDETGHLIGIVTDGDLRRALERKADIYALNTRDIMTKNPVSISDSAMAVEALKMMKVRNISVLPVVNKKGILVGMITINGLIEAGLVI